MKKTFFFVIYTLLFVLSSNAQLIYVSPQGNDLNTGNIDSPFQTVSRALKEAREWRRLNQPGIEKGITILLDDGVYRETKTLLIRPEDSGTKHSPTMIRAIHPLKAAISGGIAVEQWQQGCNDPRIAPELRSKIWCAEAPKVGNRHLETRQMWVNGVKVQRASQFPNGVMERMIDFNPTEETITIPTLAKINLSYPQQLEMMVHQRWAIAILRVASLQDKGEQTIVRFHQPESQLEFAHPWPQPIIDGERGSSSFCLMNALELLDEPGEWYAQIKDF